MTTKDVHTEHCCKVHGCKYGDAECSVVTRQKRQSFACEDCPPWSADWPTKPGRYWFYGRPTLDEMTTPTLNLVVATANMAEDGTPRLDVLGPNGVLDPVRGTHGFWLEAELPDLPVMELPKPDTKLQVKLKPLPKNLKTRKMDSAAPMPIEVQRYAIEGGALTTVPIWEDHRRGRNWMAVLKPNPTAPGGWDRRFAEKARGDLFYIMSDVFLGDILEFGADYYTGMGKKNPRRTFGVVTSISQVAMEMVPFPDAKAALGWRRENLHRSDDE